MSFQRARTDEQRGERRRQILAAAAAMLTEMPVAELTLTALSRRVCLAKANVLRYFESREAVLLALLEAEIADWIAELESAAFPGGTVRERGDRLADLLATSLVRRPALCDLVSAQSTVLEHNISAETALQHKRAVHRYLETLVRFAGTHLPELGDEDAAALMQTVMLVAVAAWPASRPPQAVLDAYAADPALGVMCVDFADVVRRAVEMTASGLLARGQ
ncbi:TetR/AcrR family transcriptional regulator [Lentzea sp. NBC_00516]|uniref:TetR/AcrR family transcriptional regulator n=1 Tax=Lentzea sp. NBC_00516 TaxID=2903582 RepID=UPI002E801E6F|nr:TetR/AcrR family transcriptional regulator [Lentzea sp. NBC_00516]WUD22952.1 TetR/AcrR family transcriptional regulator [Lentzea sp. NBC_00516]